MCKVYNQVGCLTTIKSHLHENGIHEYKSVNELINFQKKYFGARQQIIVNHKLLIEQEKNGLTDEIVQLDHSIKTKKNELELQQTLELEKLKQQLQYLSSTRPGIIHSLINYFKNRRLQLSIKSSELIFNSKIAYSLKPLIAVHNEKTKRYEYIVSSFEDAVIKSGSSQLRELDRKKRVIDRLNSSIYGALGEQKVVKELEKLSDDHILINDFCKNISLCHLQQTRKGLYKVYPN